MVTRRLQSYQEKAGAIPKMDRVEVQLTSVEAAELLNHLVSTSPEGCQPLEQAMLKLASALRNADRQNNISEA